MSEAHREGDGAAAAASPVRPAEELFDTLAELGNHMKAHFDRVVQPLGLPAPCAKALLMIEGAASMKELGLRIHCDGSFVTSIADALEERGLARREIDHQDRRIKNLVLTRKGTELRTRLMNELFADFPGLPNLTESERDSFLALLRKMVDPERIFSGNAPWRAAR
jgi:MarR family transcriptional regulator, organic hydroperoxide resistance regulator